MSKVHANRTYTVKKQSNAPSCTTHAKSGQKTEKPTTGTMLPTTNTAKNTYSIPYCSMCSKRGHRTDECFSTYLPKQDTLPYCSACLKHGHSIQECYSRMQPSPFDVVYYPSRQEMIEAASPLCKMCSKRGHKAEDCFSLYVPPGQRKYISSYMFQHPIIAKYKSTVRTQIHSQPAKHTSVIGIVEQEAIVNAFSHAICLKTLWVTTVIETGQVGYVCINEDNNVYLEKI